MTRKRSSSYHIRNKTRKILFFEGELKYIHFFLCFQFKYKKRVYKMMHVNVRKLKQLHVKVGSVDFPGGGGGIKYLKIFATYP